MDRPGVWQVPEGSGKLGKMEKTGCKIICGAAMTLAFKGLMMMMMMMMMNHWCHYYCCSCVITLTHYCCSHVITETNHCSGVISDVTIVVHMSPLMSLWSCMCCKECHYCSPYAMTDVILVASFKCQHLCHYCCHSWINTDVIVVVCVSQSTPLFVIHEYNNSGAQEL